MRKQQLTAARQIARLQPSSGSVLSPSTSRAKEALLRFCTPSMALHAGLRI